MNDNERITPSTLVGWLVVGFGALIFAAIVWVGNNAADIPVIKEKQEQASADLSNIKSQIIDVPVIKVQMDNMTKQLDRINSMQDSSERAIEDSRNKIIDHEHRIQALELRHR